MIIESGMIVAAGLLLAFFKCKWTWRMKMLSSPLGMDCTIFIVLNILHWGTFSGVMVAAVGALICSGLISLGRFLFGYVEKNIYYPGVKNVSKELIK